MAKSDTDDLAAKIGRKDGSRKLVETVSRHNRDLKRPGTHPISARTYTKEIRKEESRFGWGSFIDYEPIAHSSRHHADDNLRYFSDI